MQIDLSNFERPASIEQAEDECTRMQILALTYWIRYELFLGVRDPFELGDEMQRKMAAVMREHDERKRIMAQQQRKGA